MKILKNLYIFLLFFIASINALNADSLEYNAADFALKECKNKESYPKSNEMPSWRNGYVISVESARLYTAPLESCKLDSKQSRENIKNIMEMTYIPQMEADFKEMEHVVALLANKPSNPTHLARGDKITILSSSGNFYKFLYHTQIDNQKAEIIGFIKKSDAKLAAFNFDFYFTLVCMVAVLLLGRIIINRIKFLQDYNIPEPVVGGILAAIFILCVYKFLSIEFKFDSSLKDPLMLAFFASIGLSADFASLKRGGKMLGIFLIVVIALLFVQNIIGVSVAYAMGTNPLLGMLGGSITLSGGHGTGAAWAGIFSSEPYNFAAAMEVAMACATFGLIMGGIIGGPTARFLIKHYKLKTPGREHNNDDPHGFETPQKERLITPISFIESLALIAICLLVGNLLSDFVKSVTPQFNLPTFVYCLFVGVILRNALSATNIHHVFDREVSVLGNVSLSLFLAFAMMTLNLWELVALALPMIVILATQAVCMVLFAIFVTFRFCGRDYDAAVLASGHCGFGLGATPTAMVNMQAVTSHYGPSHVAFIIVPLVGAFFIDIINAVVIQVMLKILPI